MNFATYADMLWPIAKYSLKFLLILAPFCLAPAILYLYLKIAKKKLSNDTDVLIQNVAVFFAGIYLIFIFYIGSDVIPIFKDIMGENYLCAHGEYTIKETSYNRSGDTAPLITMTTDNGDIIKVWYLSGVGFMLEDGGVGTMWYSENSEYILEFVPDEAIDGK